MNAAIATRNAAWIKMEAYTKAAKTKTIAHDIKDIKKAVDSSRKIETVTSLKPKRAVAPPAKKPRKIQQSYMEAMGIILREDLALLGIGLRVVPPFQ
mmetsp:Transcript_28602/g.52841  ORF Transcript_28602/g.52841 Transcript_28602/m.52841 type:complete len:97 (+) Transcript_28602:69-359(+)